MKWSLVSQGRGGDKVKHATIDAEYYLSLYHSTPHRKSKKVVLSFISSEEKSEMDVVQNPNQGPYHRAKCHQGPVRPPENSAKDARNSTNRMRSFKFKTGP
jgi:hypothetical protein